MKLALRAMAIAAGSLHPMLLATGLALVADGAVFTGPAVDNGLNGFAMLLRGLRVALQILGTEGTKYFSDSTHLSPPSSMNR